MCWQGHLVVVLNKMFMFRGWSGAVAFLKMPCPVFNQKERGPVKPQAPRSTSEAEPPVLFGAGSVTELEKNEMLGRSGAPCPCFGLEHLVIVAETELVGETKFAKIVSAGIPSCCTS